MTSKTKLDRVLASLPFCKRDQIIGNRISKSYRLVGTDSLRIIGIGYCPNITPRKIPEASLAMRWIQMLLSKSSGACPKTYNEQSPPRSFKRNQTPIPSVSIDIITIPASSTFVIKLRMDIVVADKESFPSRRAVREQISLEE